MKRFILETSYETDKQKVYWIKYRPTVTEKGWKEYVTRINAFFHRNAKDNIKYNVTRFRQFTIHDEFEIKYYKRKDLNLAIEEIELETLNDFFDKVGFNYKTKCMVIVTGKQIGRAHV